MQDFRDLKVWGRAHHFVLELYQATMRFPDAERFGLSAQMRRAAVSVPANIAEGSVRSTDADFGRFLHMAIGSASEVDYYLLLARDLGYLSGQDYERLDGQVQEIRRMLNALISRVRTAQSQQLKANS
jgi:four helix bundle protein